MTKDTTTAPRDRNHRPGLGFSADNSFRSVSSANPLPVVNSAGGGGIEESDRVAPRDRNGYPGVGFMDENGEFVAVSARNPLPVTGGGGGGGSGTLPRGPMGPQGTPGRDGERGEKGEKGDDGRDGQDAKNIEMSKNSTHIVWRREGENDWKNLVALDEIRGRDGQDGNSSTTIEAERGKSVILRKNDTHLQWSHEGENNWQDLIPLTELQGLPGTPGRDGAQGAPGAAGRDGINGKSVEIQKTATHVQWRQTGGNWANLIAISELVGPEGQRGAPGRDGQQGPAGRDGSPGRDGERGPQGIPGTPGAAGRNGENGKNINLRTTATHIQWQLAGDKAWRNLVAFSDLAGSHTHTMSQVTGLENELARRLKIGNSLPAGLTAERKTKAEFSAITVKDPNTIYFVIEN